MRTYLLDLLHDLLFDPSMLELITSGDEISRSDFLASLASILAWAAATKLVMILIRPLLIRTLGVAAARLGLAA